MANRPPCPLIRIFFVLWCTCGIAFTASAQTDNASAGADLFNTARTFIKSGDYSNAVLVLNQAIQADPNNLEYRQQLAYAYYLRQDNDQAFKIIHELLERDDADQLTYQIAGDIYQARTDYNGADKLYRKGIKKFPESGELYNDLGNLLYKEKKYQDALRLWVNGIRVDPAFADNYYNAARTYYYSKDNIWSIIYGEIFINLESFSNRTAEIRGILLASYKKLFDNPKILTGDVDAALPEQKENIHSRASQDGFSTVFLATLATQSSVIASGITTKSLIMLRIRFLIAWETHEMELYPFSLFTYEQQLARQGLFEAYNQWIFGPASSPAEFRNWMNLHKDKYEEMIQYLQDHPFKPSLDQAYNTGKIIFEENGSHQPEDQGSN
jgi:Tfp pilus assembly protein PilF